MPGRAGTRHWFFVAISRMKERMSTIKWIAGSAAGAMALVGAILLAWNPPLPNPGATAASAASSGPASASVSTQESESPPATAPRDGPFVVKRILPIDGPIKYGEWHWDEDGVPDGPLVVTVDLEARVISVFRGGYEIGAAAVLLGTDEHPTPLGTFPILQKKRHNTSSIYDADMPYTMRLTWDGISIHGAPVENGYASHGCIGTPNDFAAKLFAIIEKGDKVIVTRGKMVGVGDNLAGETS